MLEDFVYNFQSLLNHYQWNFYSFEILSVKLLNDVKIVWIESYK